MQKPNDWESEKRGHFAWSSVFLFGFGLTVLLFLVVIERPNWFHIRPVSGTAQALSYTAQQPIHTPTASTSPASAR